MKKVMIVFISLILIAPASGQIYLEQVDPGDIYKPYQEWPTYMGCISYSGEGGDLSIIPVESHQSSGWRVFWDNFPIEKINLLFRHGVSFPQTPLVVT